MKPLVRKLATVAMASVVAALVWIGLHESAAPEAAIRTSADPPREVAPAPAAVRPGEAFVTIPSDDETRSAVAVPVEAAETITIRVRVVDPLQRPLDYFGVRAIRRDGNGWFVEDRKFEPQFHAGGEFDLADLPPGVWELIPFADEFKFDHPLRIARTFDKRFDLAVSGRTMIAGVVVDEAGEPVADAEVVFTEPRSSAHHVPRTSTRTNISGAFEFALPWGTHWVRASARNFTPSASRRLDLGARERLPRIELVLRRGVMLHGTALDADERPLEGWTVSMVAPFAGTADRAVIDAQGRFELVGHELGETTLNVWRQADGKHWSYFATVDFVPDAEKHVTLHIARDRPVLVVGHVAADPSALPGTIRARPFEGLLTTPDAYRARLDADGRFELSLPCAGRYSFTGIGGTTVVGSQIVDVPDQAVFQLELAP